MTVPNFKETEDYELTQDIYIILGCNPHEVDVELLSIKINEGE